MISTNDLKLRLSELKGQKNALEREFAEKESTLISTRERKEDYIQARWVLAEVASQTQQRFKTTVENLVTMAIRSVFDRPFEFKLIFEQKRNKFECRPVVIEGDNEYIPKDDMGGGIIDLISFAFRIVLWEVQADKSRSTIILDEPFRFVGKALIKRAGKMIKELSKELDIQFIITTHETELAEIADKGFNVKHNGTYSTVKEFDDDETGSAPL